MSTRVVCICGSMRFEREMREVAVEESLNGAIVLMPLVNMKRPDPRWSAPADAERCKAGLDRLHLAKIDAAHEVIVVAPGGYIGQSTQREIAYAEGQGKAIRYTDGSGQALCGQCRQAPVWHPGARAVDGRFCESCITRCLETDTDPRCPVCHAAIVRLASMGARQTPTTEGGTR